MIEEYYDNLAQYYKYIYKDWDLSVERQSDILDRILKDLMGNGELSILDAACGIGTQCIGLAKKGYRVTASDLSANEIKISQQEAEKNNLVMDFYKADMRELWEIHGRQFDVVIACDNAIPHLLSEVDILKAFKEFYKCTKPGGCCMISVRDYEKVERVKSGKQMNPRTIHQTANGNIILFDVWDFDEEYYDLTTYIVEDNGEAFGQTRMIRGGRYFCVTISRLKELLLEAGFEKFQVLRDVYFQPLLIVRKSE